jgi:hypothetical protein
MPDSVIRRVSERLSHVRAVRAKILYFSVKMLRAKDNVIRLRQRRKRALIHGLAGTSKNVLILTPSGLAPASPAKMFAGSTFYRRSMAFRARAFDLSSLPSSLSCPPMLIRITTFFFKT